MSCWTQSTRSYAAMLQEHRSFMDCPKFKADTLTAAPSVPMATSFLHFSVSVTSMPSQPSQFRNIKKDALLVYSYPLQSPSHGCESAQHHKRRTEAQGKAHPQRLLIVCCLYEVNQH